MQWASSEQLVASQLHVYDRANCILTSTSGDRIASSTSTPLIRAPISKEACDDLPKFGSLQLKISGDAKAGLLCR